MCIRDRSRTIGVAHTGLVDRDDAPSGRQVTQHVAPEVTPRGIAVHADDRSEGSGSGVEDVPGQPRAVGVFEGDPSRPRRLEAPAAKLIRGRRCAKLIGPRPVAGSGHEGLPDQLGAGAVEPRPDAHQEHPVARDELVGDGRERVRHRGGSHVAKLGIGEWHEFGIDIQQLAKF